MPHVSSVKTMTHRVGSRFQILNDVELVDENSASGNHVASWLRRLDALRAAA